MDRKDIGVYLKELKEIMEFDVEELIQNVITTGGQITNIRFQGLQKNNSLYLTRNSVNTQILKKLDIIWQRWVPPPQRR